MFLGDDRLPAADLDGVDRTPKFVLANACESGIMPQRPDLSNPEIPAVFAEAKNFSGNYATRGVGLPTSQRGALISTMAILILLGALTRAMPVPHPINLKLNHTTAKYRVGGVGYLNTTPLVWGMLHWPQRELVDLSLSLPSECAQEVENGVTQIGLVPVAEVARQGLEMIPGVGIACLGAVRSILLFSRVPWPKVRTLAADASSRTSVQLARVILRERYGVEPQINSYQPDLDEMLKHADAALIIGDPALRLDPDHTPYEWLDLGQEWFNLTQLPMVFAVWAGKARLPIHELSQLTRASYEFGQARIDEIVAAEYAGRGITRELADAYLRRYIRFEIGPREQRGLDSFFELAGLTEGAKL